MKEKNLTKIICEAIKANGKIVPAIIAAIVVLVAVPTYIVIIKQIDDGDSSSYTESASESDSETDDYRIPVSIDFDANEGNTDVSSTVVYYGEKYGALPEAQREYYDFIGWHTAIEGGNPINKDTYVTNSEPHTLYAHWNEINISVSLNANGGDVTPNKVNVILGGTYSNLPTPQRDNYIFDGWYTSANGGGKVNNRTKVEHSSPDTLYAHWIKGTISVPLDANGGTVNTNSITVYFGGNYGSLPTPRRDYYTFEGWYTAPSGGSLVESNTIVDSSTPHTLYAHWKQNNISDWVSSSAVPYGAEIVDQKWTYTKTETKESNSSSESGWTQAGSYWKNTDTGTNTYAKFPTNSNGREYYSTSDQFYKSYSTDVYTGYETNNAKREVSGEQIKSYIYYHWVYPLEELGEDNREIGEYKGKWINDGGYANIWESFEGEYVEYNSRADAYEIHGHSTYSYWWNGRIPVYTQTYTDYTKIYQYIRENRLESSVEIVAGSDISNVQKLVRYRPK